MTQLPAYSPMETLERRRMLRRRMFWTLLLTSLVFGAVFGMKWFGNRMMVQYLENRPVPPATISAAPVQMMRWDNRLETIGTLVAVNGTDVTTQVGGIITAIHFESGQRVAKGARLISLDAATEQADFRRLQAQAALAEVNRARREKLYKLQAISKADYDAAVTEANAAKAAAEAQRARLEQKEIRAPFDGQLGIRKVNVGQYINPGEAIVTLQSLNPIDVDFSLPEQHLSVVAPGNQVAVEVDGHPGEQFRGEVLAVEPRVDVGTRNFMVRARLDNSQERLRAGQFGHVRLTLPGERDLLVVPRTAVNYSPYGTSIFVLQKKTAEAPQKSEGPAAEGPVADFEVVQRFIKTGDARGDFVAIVEGVREGEHVATTGLLKLRNGQPVIINNDMGPRPQLEPKLQER